MLKKCVLISTLICCVFIGAVWADNQAEAPDVHVGDMWKYREIDAYTNEVNVEFSHRIVKLDSNEIVIQLQNKKSAGKVLKYFTREWNQVASADVTWEPYLPENRFPVKVGDSWNKKFRFSKTNGSSFSSFVKAKVVSFEKVAVPAGTFDAYKVVRDIETRSSDSEATIMRGQIVSWYAPSVKKFVRSESTEFANGRERSKKLIELVEFLLQGES